MNANLPMIEITALRKSYGDLEVLKEINLKVETGGVVSLIGPSGSGKSTLLRCINLLVVPDDGAIRVGKTAFSFGQALQPPRSRPGSSRWCDISQDLP